MHSPIEYASVFAADPVPDLDHIFYVSGLAEGTNMNELSRLLRDANIGRARLTRKARGAQVGCFHASMMSTVSGVKP
jgi:hypothetical protein